MEGHRFIVNFSDSAHEELFTLSREQRRSPAEVLRNAIALLKWFDEMEESGNRVLVESPGGCVHEVSLRD